MSTITRRIAQVARPGVIVSTLVDEGRVETVTFTRDLSARPGFTTKVERSDKARDADAMHALAVAEVRP